MLMSVLMGYYTYILNAHTKKSQDTYSHVHREKITISEI